MITRQIAFVAAIAALTTLISVPVSAQADPRERLQSEAWEKCLNIDDSGDSFDPGANCRSAGYRYSHPDFPKNLIRARFAYSKSCEKGSHSACVSFAKMAINGEGGDADLNSARKAFARACDLPRSDDKGCSELANMALDGIGGPQDLQLAYRASTKACDKASHNLDSCAQSALLAFQGVAPDSLQLTGDLQRFAAAITPLCDLEGNATAFACYHAGRAVMAIWQNSPTEADPTYAFRAFDRSCNWTQGRLTDACFYRAILLYDGIGVPKDEESAKSMMEALCFNLRFRKACNEFSDMQK